MGQPQDNRNTFRQIDLLSFFRAVTIVGVLVVGTVVATSQFIQSAEPLVMIAIPQGTIIQAELANTAPKRATGLMYRDSLPSDHGMLFVFAEEQEWSFWMKNTRIPLDIIWIDKTKKIVHVERNVPICTRTDDSCPNYQPISPALYVLELKAGRADDLKLQRGTRLKFEVPPVVQ